MKIRVGGDEKFLSLESIELIEFYLEPVKSELKRMYKRINPKNLESDAEISYV